VGRRHPLLVAIQPVADALGATIVVGARLRAGDVPLRWEGELVGGLRLPGAFGTLDRLIASVELELGASLGDLSREQRHEAVELLHQRGGFELRRSVETVAERMGVSRFTVYNYLHAADG
jgi:hypothetical protein